MTANLPPQPVPTTELAVDELLQDVDGVIVDWDGTVVDNAEIRLSALQQALAPYGVDVDPQWYALNCGLPIREVVARLAGQRTLPVEEIVPASRRLLLGGPPPRLIDSTIDLLRRAEALGCRGPSPPLLPESSSTPSSTGSASGSSCRSW